MFFTLKPIALYFSHKTAFLEIFKYIWLGNTYLSSWNFPYAIFHLIIQYQLLSFSFSLILNLRKF